VRKLFCLVVLVWFVAQVPLASADSELSPKDFKVFSENKEYVFVALAARSVKLFGLDLNLGDWLLRMKYPKTGLYRNDGSTTPLWVLEPTLDWNAEIFISSNGKHLVVMGRWPRFWDEKDMEKGGAAFRQLALAFVENGRVVKGYSIEALARDQKSFPRTVSHFEWCKATTFNDKEKRLFVETYDKQKLVFNNETGELVERANV